MFAPSSLPGAPLHLKIVKQRIVVLSAKGAAFTAGLGQRPRKNESNKGISAESAIHACPGSSISAPD
jgi:hypothetical protein